jgi:anti-anti-sigma regulatory factor
MRDKMKSRHVVEVDVAQSDPFLYTVSKSSSVLASSFSGVLGIDSQSEFERFTKEALSDPSIRVVLIDFTAVANVTVDLLPALVLFQKQCRIQNIEIRLCALGEELKNKLFKLGVIRYRELAPSLREGLLNLGQIPKSAPVLESVKKAS